MLRSSIETDLVSQFNRPFKKILKQAVKIGQDEFSLAYLGKDIVAKLKFHKKGKIATKTAKTVKKNSFSIDTEIKVELKAIILELNGIEIRVEP